MRSDVHGSKPLTRSSFPALPTLSPSRGCLELLLFLFLFPNSMDFHLREKICRLFGHVLQESSQDAAASHLEAVRDAVALHPPELLPLCGSHVHGVRRFFFLGFYGHLVSNTS